MRLQLALNVQDLDSAVAFYEKLFATPPHKRRPGYANFAVADPPLKLVLFENPNADQRLNHLGVEVLDSGEMNAQIERLEEVGLAKEVQKSSNCCHAVQDKVWLDEPDGTMFEVYRILDDDPAPLAQSSCCATG